MSGIIRTKKDTNYTTIKNTAFKDKNLSWGAKGLFAFLMTLPDDWQTYISHLKTISKDGRDSTSAKLKELIDFDYIKKGKQIRDNGQFKGFEYTIYEDPLPLRKTRYGKTVTENPKLISTNLLNTNKNLSKDKKKPLVSPLINDIPIEKIISPKVIHLIKEMKKVGVFPNIIFSKPGQKPSKTFLSIEKFLFDIKDGRINREIKLNEDFINRHNIKLKQFKLSLTWEEIESILKKACKRFRIMKNNKDKWPPKKEDMSKIRFNDFLYNDRKQTSWFFLCYFNRPWNTLIKGQSDNLDKTLDKIQDTVGEASAASAQELLEAFPNWNIEKFRYSLIDLWDWYEDNKKDLKFYNDYNENNSSWSSYLGKFYQVCDLLKEFLLTWDSPNPGQISPNSNTWGYFTDYVKIKLKIELNPGPVKLKNTKDWYKRQTSTG